jgi:hypothetical protein
MKIKFINFRAMRSNEHFQFITEFRDLVIRVGAETVKISAEFQLFLVCYLNEDNALKKITKSALTEEIETADSQRDHAFRGLVESNATALTHHYDADVVAAAKRIKVPLDAYGNIAAMPINEETSAICNLLQELTGKYAQDVQTAGLSGWVNRLVACNNTLDTLVKERNAENAEKTHLSLKTCRVETDRVYHVIANRINALILIDGPDNYAMFADKLNAFIDKYNNIIAQRTGRAKAKKQSEL